MKGLHDLRIHALPGGGGGDDRKDDGTVRGMEKEERP